MCQQVSFTSREIAWSKKDNERPLFIESICKGEDSTTVKYRYLGMPNEYKIPFIDDASIENSLHCLAVALYMMVPAEDIAERMAHLEQIAMRLEVKEGKMGVLLSTTAIIRIWPLWILHLISCRAVRKIKVKTHIDSFGYAGNGAKQ